VKSIYYLSHKYDLKNIVQAAKCRLLTAERQIRSPATSYEIREGRNGTEECFVLSFFGFQPLTIIPPLREP
jgi:hypothetical protein